MARNKPQFALPSLELLRAYRVAAQKVCAAPWMAFPPILLHNAVLLALLASVPDIDADCTAARWAVVGRSAALRDTWRCFEVARHSDEAAVAVLAASAHARPWHAHSSMMCIFFAEALARGAAAAAAGPPEEATQRQWAGALRRAPDMRRSFADAARDWTPSILTHFLHSLASFANASPPPARVDRKHTAHVRMYLQGGGVALRIVPQMRAADAQQHYLMCTRARDAGRQ